MSKISIEDWCYNVFMDFIKDQGISLDQFSAAVKKSPTESFSGLKPKQLILRYFQNGRIFGQTFDWSETKEGFDFWSKVSSAFEKYLNDRYQNIESDNVQPIALVSSEELRKDPEKVKTLNAYIQYKADKHFVTHNQKVWGIVNVSFPIHNIPSSLQKIVTVEELFNTHNITVSKFVISDEMTKILKNYRGEIRDMLFNFQFDKKYDYLDIDSKGMITFLPVEKVKLVDPSEYFTSSRRQGVKPGRFIKKCFDGVFDDCIVEDFVNFIYGMCAEIDIQILDCKDIKRIYHEKNYAEAPVCGGSTLHNSCMRYAGCQEFMKFYEHMNTQIAVIFSPTGKVMARALLWKTNKGYFLDRVYYTIQSLVPRMIHEIGKMVDLQFTHVGGGEVTRVSDGRRGSYGLMASAPEGAKPYNGKFPYLDSLMYYDSTLKAVSNDRSLLKSTLTLRRTGGGAE